MQGGGGSVSVWECMSGGAHGPLMIYIGRVNSAAYIEIIKDALPMFIENAFDVGNNNWVYMHDNAPSYTSKYSMKWFKDNNINVLKWSANSPDLNPIENIWDHFDKELRKLKPTNVNQLQTMIEVLRVNTTPRRCKQLVDSMPRRIKQCILDVGYLWARFEYFQVRFVLQPIPVMVTLVPDTP